jgi:hypothetical protein
MIILDAAFDFSYFTDPNFGYSTVYLTKFVY